jgi:hypothetical protein
MLLGFLCCLPSILGAQGLACKAFAALVYWLSSAAAVFFWVLIRKYFLNCLDSIFSFLPPFLHTRLRLIIARSSMAVQQQTPAASTSVHIDNSMICQSWILDFGASAHVVGNPSLVSNLSPPKIPQHIICANGSKAQVIGIGQASPLPSLSLNDVLYVPGFPYNLISTSELAHSHNCSITFNSNSFFIQDRSTGKTIATGSESQGIYYLHSHTSTVCSDSTSPDIIRHGLAHLSLDKLKVMVPQLSHLKTLD